MMLATVAELEATLAYDVDADRAQQILLECSALVAGECFRVQFEQSVDDEVKLRGTWDRFLHLPRGPVESVTSAEVDGDEVDDFTLLVDGNQAWLVRDRSWGGPEVQVDVVYTHGYEDVPDDVNAFVLAFARRAFTNPEQVMQKRYEDNSVSIASSIEEASGPLKSELRALQARYGRTGVSAVTL